ncbi:glycosyltransferase family 2 protein [Herbiconiux sp. P15]|uniref:glycosyltransferase family 2 protein n=1 Tax=Herbiconiux liukaitaii TaxID=3342799 RepID=UPI0035B78DAB
MTRTALITIVHGRREHLLQQRRAVLRSVEQPDHHVIVAMDDEELGRSALPELEGVHLVHLRSAPTEHGLPLARARNLGAATARALGAEVLVFLDVDCLPGEALIGAYREAAVEHGGRLLSGPVTYLDPPPTGGYDLTALTELDAPHAARPAPAAAEIELGGRHELFWSLSFAVTTATWLSIGGFSEEYSGYGGEDTDFAFCARARGVELAWIGSARAYHQHHEVERPPVSHLDDIVRNGAVFARHWGSWPMLGWLEEFERRGLVMRTADGGFERTRG